MAVLLLRLEPFKLDLFTEHVHALGALREGDGVVAGLLLATSIATSLAM
jgi:hypothetical protein